MVFICRDARPQMQLHLGFVIGVSDNSLDAHGALELHHHIFRFDRASWHWLIRSLGSLAANPEYPISFFAAAAAAHEIRSIAFTQGWI